MNTYKIPQIKLSYVSDSISEKPRITCAIDIEKLIRADYEPGEIEFREHFKVVYMNRANKLIGINTVSLGGTNATIVDPKIIFAGALLANASHIVLCHNHPSGNLSPSAQDDKLTAEIKAGCTLLGLKLFDHIILTQEGFYSYNDNRRII